MTNKEKIARLYELKQAWDDNKKIIDDELIKISKIQKKIEPMYGEQQVRYDEYFKLYNELEDSSTIIPDDIENSLIPPKESDK